MSDYENVVVGKLKLKGQALDVKAGGVKKRKKHTKHRKFSTSDSEASAGNSSSNKFVEEPFWTIGLTSADVLNLRLEGEGASYHANDLMDGKSGEVDHQPSIDDYLTPAERRYMEQKEKFDHRRMASIESKSHRDRIQEFNQYLANLSEHYDIPKVGPG